MEMKSQALLLQTFLGRYTSMYNHEIMNEYPESLESYPPEWISLLDTLTEVELYSIDCKKSIDQIKGSGFGSFMEEAKSLCSLSFIPDLPQIPLEDWAFNGIKKKKRHEIEKIIPVLKKLKKTHPFNYVVDIGGGVGHLSRILAHYHFIPSVSVDRNSEFQKIGLKRLQKYRKIEGAQEVDFLTLSLGNEDDKLKTLFKPEAFSLGLHTCGPLANILIKKTIDYKTSGLLSFGCCYHHLNPTTDFPLSAFYKENDFLNLNLFALSLATRSHSEMSFHDYQTRERVKYYRYGLHLFLMDHFNKNYFTEVGECPIKIYWGPFSTYVKSKLTELKLDYELRDEEIDLFFQSPKIQKKLRVMWLANIIRWQLGRCLEVYLLLDRALYLKEHGYDVTIEQFFDEALSPRNIGILGILKTNSD